MQVAPHVIWGAVELSSESKSQSHSSSSNKSSKSKKDGKAAPAPSDRRLPLRGPNGQHIDFLDSSGDSSGKTLDGIQRAMADGRHASSSSAGHQEGPGSSDEDLEDELEEPASPSAEWSVGSQLHAAGQCKPCHYVKMPGGCYNGKDCTFCHLPHSKSTRSRPCKNKRMKWKRFAGFLEQLGETNPDNYAEAVAHARTQSSYLRSLLSKADEDADPRSVDRGNAASSSSRQAPSRNRDPARIVSL